VTGDQLVTFAGLSDIGRLRGTNQDRWGADPEQSLFIVADGVARSTDGALAATLIVELLPTYVSRHVKPDVDDAAEALGRAEGDPFSGPVAMRLGVDGSWSTVERTRSGVERTRSG
jgi:serine/threonine protein phosphatase PrpC